ncbi:penicillin-binding protein activator [Planctobacterium marinum]|uniref:penicillin-binding protein activator n=1 Tax=Planctobacterium marinum TaxID=1631968 RepID=UPI001E41A854|nr:penicillin-binding protein activator [Planctobacterium marinum]MCC2604897.1 penicillin-binding protein activator [Planctobacterium marinum]
MLQNKYLNLLLLVLLLAGCGSTPKKTTSVQASPTPTETRHTNRSPEALLALAEQSESPASYLIELVETVAKTHCTKAIDIAHLVQTRQLLTSAQQQQLAITQSQCLLQTSNYVAAESMLESIPDNSPWMQQKHDMLYQVYLGSERWWLAANSLAISGPSDYANELKIWAIMQKLSDQEIATHQKEISRLNPLLQLLVVQRQLTHSDESTDRQFSAWQSRFPNHLFARQLPDDIAGILARPKASFENVLVLLPLSGPRQAQGEAIKEGILAANFSSNFAERQLDFVDTQSWTTDNPPQLDFTGYDLVIGPLLKENIDQIQALIPEGLPVLFLNRTENAYKQLGQYYYSLAPEDEAVQLAQNLHLQGIRQPMLIASENATYQRMKSAFSEEWLKKNLKAPVILDFVDNNDVRQGVNDTLALTDSKERVAQIRNLLRPELHAFERNRRDIDAIIILANTTQTELINPLIEASTSPFAEIIPVYATSRSFSRNLSNNDLRDLRNLYFIEMPWMLGEAQYSWLQKQTDKLWPGRRDALQRLFAMGYDAFNMAPYLPLLAQFENQSWQGLTGTIRLNNLNQTERTIKAAQFTEQEVILLEGD